MKVLICGSRHGCDKRDAMTQAEAETLLDTALGRLLRRHPARYFLEVYKTYEPYLSNSELLHAKRFLKAAVRLETRVLDAMHLLGRKRPVLV